MLPPSDPAFPIVNAILRVVPASRWSFARLMPSGELTGLLLDSPETGGELLQLSDEFKLQRAKVSKGPRLAATLGPLGEFESGVTLLFADAQASFGILTLLRTSELGPFTSSEISVLTLALDSTSERLSDLRLDSYVSKSAAPSHAKAEDDAPNSEEAQGAFYVLDRDLQI